MKEHTYNDDDLRTSENLEQNGNVFLVSFDDSGIDIVQNLTFLANEDVFDKIHSDKDKFHSKLDFVMFCVETRAKYNSHRNYEAWAIKISDDVSEKCFREFAKENPAVLINLLKENGKKLY